MLGIENAKHQVAKFETFVERPCHCHGARVDEKPKTEHDVGNGGVPFLGTEAALSTIVNRKAEEQAGSTNALMKSLAHAVTTGCHAVIIDERGVGEAEKVGWRKRRMESVWAGSAEC
jgi:hypothetical protein